MASLSTTSSLMLPAPKKSRAPVVRPRKGTAGPAGAGAAVVGEETKKLLPPSYEERCRTATMVSKLPSSQRKGIKLFVPRSLQDFGDGGAFPEIHVAQYPRHMGNPHIFPKSNNNNKQIIARGNKGGGSNNATPSGFVGSQSNRTLVHVEIDKDGQVSYDAIVKGGTNSDKLVYSKLEDVKGGEADPEAVALPTQEEEEKSRQKTAAALGALLATQTAMDKPSGSALAYAATSKDQESKTQFIKYTPRPDAPGYNPAAAQRVIQMVPAQVDPMMPPKHKHRKAPRGPAEDPVPVLHGPPPKLTKEERDAWNIPACVSNWKNTRGYTIPLDKRLAADGRGLRDTTTINPNFATLSESLYVAEKQARQEVKLRAQVQKRLMLQEKEQRENELRTLANQARQERNQPSNPPPKPLAGAVSDDEDEQQPRGRLPLSDDEDGLATQREQREKLRLERKRQREREFRLEQSMEGKRQKLERERDVSEKVALGQFTGSGGGTAEVDSRLYNTSSGLDSGFGRDDEYTNTYTRPLFDRPAAGGNSIYRPTRGTQDADEQYQQLVRDGVTKKFQPDKGFAGAEGGSGGGGGRTAPVQFEKSAK